VKPPSACWSTYEFDSGGVRSPEQSGNDESVGAATGGRVADGTGLLVGVCAGGFSRWTARPAAEAARIRSAAAICPRHERQACIADTNERRRDALPRHAFPSPGEAVFSAADGAEREAV